MTKPKQEITDDARRQHTTEPQSKGPGTDTVARQDEPGVPEGLPEIPAGTITDTVRQPAKLRGGPGVPDDGRQPGEPTGAAPLTRTGARGSKARRLPAAPLIANHKGRPVKKAEKKRPLHVRPEV